MAKLYKIIAFVLDLEDRGEDVIVYEVENSRYCNINVEDVDFIEIGEWYDEHPLNKIGTDKFKYFEDFKTING